MIPPRCSSTVFLQQNFLTTAELSRCRCVASEWLQGTDNCTVRLEKGFHADAISIASQRFKHRLLEVNCEFTRSLTGDHLSNLPSSLRSLNVNGCHQIDNDAVVDFCKRCPNLEELQLYWNTRITDVALKAIATCKKIRRLNLSGCQKIADEGVSALHCLQLEQLNMTRCPRVSHRALRRGLRSSHETLEILILYANPQITEVPFDHFTKLKQVDLCGSQLADEVLIKLSKCSELESANLTWCVNVTDYGVMALVAATKLNFLSLFGLTKLTDKSIDALRNLPLRALDVTGCTGIEKRSPDELLRIFPHLTQFTISS
eukprot:GEMP01039681.1.p1 GENE.GEMP01039681.1~~GEMP01039681.1.p1  ORF type:complete len:317 (+),score=47.09 GEMP01039681.1:56-1006(+)